MTTRVGTLRRSERGAAAVEAALVLPLILLILFGTIQFGLAWFRAQNLEAAAREGARIAAINSTAGEITERVRTAQNTFDPDLIGVTITPAGSGSENPCEAAGIGNYVTVTASVPAGSGYDVFIPLWGDYPIEFNAEGVFRCERD